MDHSTAKEKPDLMKAQTISFESGTLSHLTPFRNRLDPGSRSSSRRGSGIFTQKSVDIIKLEKDALPLLQCLTLERQNSDPTESLKGEEPEQTRASNSLALNENSLNRNSGNQRSQPKIKLKDCQANSVGNHKSNKVGNNNWIPKIATASSFDNGTKKNNDGLKDYSSVPLLSKADMPNDSIV